MLFGATPLRPESKFLCAADSRREAGLLAGILPQLFFAVAELMRDAAWTVVGVCLAMSSSDEIYVARRDKQILQVNKQPPCTVFRKSCAQKTRQSIM